MLFIPRSTSREFLNIFEIIDNDADEIENGVQHVPLQVIIKCVGFHINITQSNMIAVLYEIFSASASIR